MTTLLSKLSALEQAGTCKPWRYERGIDPPGRVAWQEHIAGLLLIPTEQALSSAVDELLASESP